LFPSDHPNYAGDVGIGPNPKLAARFKESDLLIMIGARLSEMPSLQQRAWREDLRLNTDGKIREGSANHLVHRDASPAAA
jgi:thiamine pyrophosphate-dependent acetolactate synthase large subunit-like protein